MCLSSVTLLAANEMNRSVCQANNNNNNNNNNNDPLQKYFSAINIFITIVTVFFGRNLQIEEIPTLNKLFFPEVD